METPFYEQWWFLLVTALSSRLVILLVVFPLLLHGQSKKYRHCGPGGDAPASPRGLGPKRRASASWVRGAHATPHFSP